MAGSPELAREFPYGFGRPQLPLEKEELEEEPFKEENLTDNIKQEAAKSFIKSEEEDLNQLITKAVNM